MKWLETNPIPEECKNCTQADCYNCDMAGARWVLAAVEELRVSRKMMVRAVVRLKRKIAEIDAKLGKFTKM